MASASPATSIDPLPVASSAVGEALVRPREQLEALLRGRKLDCTLASVRPVRSGQDLTAFGQAAFDRELGGGLPRGQISELVGPSSSGRTSLAWAWLAAATARGESVALIDTFDRFDPETATQCGIDLAHLLWVRGQAITKTAGAIDPNWLPGTRTVDGPATLIERTIDRAIKALNLVLQSRVCTVVVLDMVDVPVSGLRRVPPTTWLRLQRVIESTDIACLLLAPIPLVRSAGGVVMTLGAESRQAHDGVVRTTATARWHGDHDRARRLAGVSTHARMTSPRWMRQGRAPLVTSTRTDRWAVD